MDMSQVSPNPEEMLVTIALDFCKNKQDGLTKFEKTLALYLMVFQYISVDGSGGFEIHKSKRDYATSIQVRNRTDPLRNKVLEFRDGVQTELKELFNPDTKKE